MSLCNDLKRHATRRSGYILYLVLSLLAVWGIISFSLSRYKSGSVSLLSRSSMQNRLTTVAQSGANEIWAVIRSEVNDKGGAANPLHFYSLVNSVFARPETEKPPANTYVCERFFDLSDLPFSNILAGEISADKFVVKGHSRIFVTRRIRKSPEAFSGHIEVLVQAVSKSDSREFVELKERRDFKTIDTRDFFDRYALYVKDYSYDYNKINQRLIIKGLEGGVVSTVYLGSRFAPAYKAFKGLTGPAPIYLDLNFRDDSNLIPGLLQNQVAPIPPGAGNVPSASTIAKTAAKGNVFWAVPMPIRFKPIYDRGSFSDSDFYSVKALQDGYYKTFVETAQKTGAEEHSLPGLILEDWKNCGGNYANSKVFKMVVSTSIDAWQYIYAYTDAQSLWEGANWTNFATTFHFTGLNDYVKFMKSFHPEKVISGKMAQIFGPLRSIPVSLEGNVFFRFFKVAFLDEFDTTITLGGEAKDLGMPAIPLHFQDPEGNANNFLNKEVRIHGIENQLMSREVNEIPVNAVFFAGIATPAASSGNPDKVFPTVSIDAISYRYKSAEDFLADRTMIVNGKKRINADGIMFIEKGNLDLSDYESFSGQGMIWLGFRGNVYLGDLAKSKPSDILKIWAQDGNFIVKSNKAAVKIHASLIATTFFSDTKRDVKSLNNRGKLIPDKHEVEIVGNLITDYLFLTDKSYGIPDGKSLTITHDPFLHSPVYPKWTTVGTVRSIHCLSFDYENRFFK
ncbi:MAG: hypothetical protein GX569_14285 [Candidatus Riflebacteria bacterium]|nr:hypothetical protein [Candidatus Riflebacteria bacterium]